MKKSSIRLGVYHGDSHITSRSDISQIPRYIYFVFISPPGAFFMHLFMVE